MSTVEIFSLIEQRRNKNSDETTYNTKGVQTKIFIYRADVSTISVQNLESKYTKFMLLHPPKLKISGPVRAGRLRRVPDNSGIPSPKFYETSVPS